MKTYSRPLLSPAFSAFGPLARRGSRASTHRAVRVRSFADSALAGGFIPVSGRAVKVGAAGRWNAARTGNDWRGAIGSTSLTAWRSVGFDQGNESSGSR